MEKDNCIELEVAEGGERSTAEMLYQSDAVLVRERKPSNKQKKLRQWILVLAFCLTLHVVV